MTTHDEAPEERARRPLRPLAEVLRARDRGENPDLIERDNLIRRREAMRDRTRMQSEGRLLVLGLFFVAAFSVVGVRMGGLATSAAEEPRTTGSGAQITSARADIVDRKGRILATNLLTQALYAHPQEMIDKPRVARELVKIFPEMDAERLLAQFQGTRKFVWIRKTLSPEQIQQVYDIGDPGLLFASRDMRLYPNGKLAAHILGGASFGDEGVNAAEVIGVAGVEKAFDNRLRDPAHLTEPLQLSIDLTVQSAVREVLAGGVQLFHAKGGSAVLMDANTGEVISMVSLPDFDPNDRPQVLLTGDQSDSPLFNRAVQGVYELGSVFKIFNMAAALDLGLLTPTSMVNSAGPLRIGRFRITDMHNYGANTSATDVIVKSSNVGSARIAQKIGAKRQREFLDSLGLLTPTPIELSEAPSGKPIVPAKWVEIQSMTIAFGHGMSTSPLHLAAAYASLLNGGHRVEPTIIKQSSHVEGPRVVTPLTSEQARTMLRAVVTRGTASFGEVPGYSVAGKTGTADKPKPRGGYYKDKVLATFAGVFPSYDPKYVFVVTLDEGTELVNGKSRREAGWISVPLTAEIIRRVAPLLGLRPEIEPQGALAVREAKNNG